MNTKANHDPRVFNRGPKTDAQKLRDLIAKVQFICRPGSDVADFAPEGQRQLMELVRRYGGGQ